MKNIALIGIDGGATKVAACHINNKNDNSFSLGNLYSEKKYSAIPAYIADFVPVEIQQQLREQPLSPIPVTPDEQQMETVYVEACALAVEEINEQLNEKELLIGIGMPGLKTEDKRGIAVLANGPRMVDYCSLLEKRLKAAGIVLAAPITRLGSDADYCGIGENYASEGAFKSCENAYYLGGGTGVADALKLNGQLYPFDLVKEWIAKSWELKSPEGKSFERYCSAAGIQSLYAEVCAKTITQLNEENIYPLQIAEKALADETEAIQTYLKVGAFLTKLIFSRITTLFYGWRGEFDFVNPARQDLSETHGHKGTLLEKIIIGQRLGDVLESEAGREILYNPLKEKLSDLISNDKDLSTEAKRHYKKIDRILVTSRLRQAPALGAAVDAYMGKGK